MMLVLITPVQQMMNQLQMGIITKEENLITGIFIEWIIEILSTARI